MDYEKSLSRHDLLWTQNTTFLKEAAFLGNGMIGVRILGEEQRGNRNVLRYILGRNDVTKDKGGNFLARVPVGQLEVCFKERVNCETKMRQSLYDAEFTADVRTIKGKAELRSFVHRIEDVLVIEFKTEGEEAVRVVWNSECDIEKCYRYTDGIIEDYYIPEMTVERKEIGGVSLGIQKYSDYEGCTFAWKEIQPEKNHKIFYGCLLNGATEIL